MDKELTRVIGAGVATAAGVIVGGIITDRLFFALYMSPFLAMLGTLLAMLYLMVEDLLEANRVRVKE